MAGREDAARRAGFRGVGAIRFYSAFGFHTERGYTAAAAGGVVLKRERVQGKGDVLGARAGMGMLASVAEDGGAGRPGTWAPLFMAVASLSSDDASF